MKEFFSVQEVAKLLNISHSAVLYHIHSGKLEAQQVGKIYIISKEDFGDFLKKHREPKKKIKGIFFRKDDKVRLGIAHCHPCCGLIPLAFADNRPDLSRA